MKIRTILMIDGLSVIGGGQRVLLDLLPAISDEFKVKVAVPSFGKLSEEIAKMQNVD